MIDNSLKYFANDRDNWYCTIIVYAAPFAAYLNTEVTLADFQLSGNIPLAYKELLNVIEIMWGAILNKAQSIISWLDRPAGFMRGISSLMTCHVLCGSPPVSLNLF